MVKDYNQLEEAIGEQSPFKGTLPVVQMDDPVEISEKVLDFLGKNGFREYEPAIVLVYDCNHGSHYGFTVKSCNRFIEDAIALNKNGSDVAEEQLATFREKYNLPDDFSPMHNIGVDKHDASYLVMGAESYTDDLYVVPVSKVVDFAKHPAMKWDCRI